MGIAMPGLFDYETGVSYIRYMNKYDALYEVNEEILAQKLSLQESDIKMRNDAEAFLIGEIISRYSTLAKKRVALPWLGSVRPAVKMALPRM